MMLIFMLLHFAYAEEPNVVQVMDPMPIISVDDGHRAPVTGSEGAEIPSVDTEVSSPLAPQTFDGFGGVVQQPFSPTEKEQEEMRLRQEEAAKKLAAARLAQEQKMAAAQAATALPKKTIPANTLPAKVAATKSMPTASTKMVAKKPNPAKPSKAVAAKPAAKVMTVNFKAGSQAPKGKSAPVATKRVPAAAKPPQPKAPPAAKPGALKVAPPQNKK